MFKISLKRVIYFCCPSVIHPFLSKIESSDIGLRLARGVIWSILGAVISRGLMLASTIAVARLLGKTGYGELGMIQSTVGMFGVFAGFGLGLTATKHVAEFRKNDPVRAGRILGLSGFVAFITGGLMALALFVCSPWLAEHTINAPHLTNLLQIGSIILFISALNGAQTGALSGFEAFKTIARVNFFVGICSFPILIAGTYWKGIFGAVWSLALNLLINWVLNHVALRQEAKKSGVPFALKGCGSEWPILWRFSLPAVLGGALVGPVRWACGAFLVNQPSGYGEMAIYNVSNQWSSAILFIPGLLAQVLLPLLSNLNQESSDKKYFKFLKINIYLNATISIIVVLPLCFMAKYIMSSYGVDFIQGENVFIVMSLTSVLIAVNNVVGSAIVSKGFMWIGFVFNAMWGVLFLCLTVFFVLEGYGALGVATAIFIAYMMHSIWQFVYLNKICKNI